MAKTDSVMKVILPLSDGFLRQIGARIGIPPDAAIRRWLKSEYPQIRAPRPDLVAELSTGDVLHIENQSRNDLAMADRMLGYYVAIHEHLGRAPIQIVLYYGEEKMRMQNRIARPELNFRYTLIDARDLDGESLIRTGNVSDNILAVLTAVRDERVAFRELSKKIRVLPKPQKEKALAAVTTFAGLRNLESIMRQEMQGMLTFEVDLMKNKILGPPLRKAISEGRAKLRAEGKIEGERLVLARQIERRFGRLSALTTRKLARMSSEQLEDAAIRILDCKGLRELLG